MCWRGNEAFSQLALFEVLARLQVINLLFTYIRHFNINAIPFCFTLAIDKWGLMEFLLLLPNVKHNI